MNVVANLIVGKLVISSATTRWMIAKTSKYAIIAQQHSLRRIGCHKGVGVSLDAVVSDLVIYLLPRKKNLPQGGLSGTIVSSSIFIY